MKLNTFKRELKLIMDDNWGDSVSAWFDVCAEMWERGMDIPSKFAYRVGAGSPVEEDSYWFGLFRNATDEELSDIAEFLYRYCSLLRKNGRNY